MEYYKKHLRLSLATLLILLHVSSSAVLRNRTNNDPGLYFPSDDVTILTVNNFNTSVYGSERAWLVEFYSNWCGYCQRAAPKYKAFATDVRGWKDLVVIAALDCANENNAPICEYFKITRYPTFRYIHENYKDDPENNGLPIVADSQTNFTEHRKNLINIIQKEQEEGRGKMYPNLKPFRSEDAKEMFETDKSATFGFLIIQEPFDVVGPSIIMDFHKVKEIVIKYKYDYNSSIKSKDSLPSLYYVDKSGRLDSIPLTTPDRQGVKTAIRDILLARDVEVPFEILKNFTVIEFDVQPVKATKEELELRQKIKAMGDVVFQLDLENALRYSLKREIHANTYIQGEKLDALRKYINVLVKYFPFGPKGKYVLRQIRQITNSSSVINGSEIGEMIKAVDQPNQGVFSGPDQWLGCRGSTSSFRGYPCGMWKLFHFLTVNAAFDSNNTKDSNPRIVLEAMHGYIKHFFGCEDCSNHFQEMAKRRNIFNVLSWEESVLWLWRAHNEVNNRLHGDATEDPEFPKIQFPSKENCPQCRTKDDFDEVEVLNYLKHVYKSENIKYMGTNPQLSHLNTAEMSSNEKQSSNGIMVLSNALIIALCGFMMYVHA